jgi:hypothetical protein
MVLIVMVALLMLSLWTAFASSKRSRLLYTTTSAASVDDTYSQPIKYRWTHPTLHVAVPALIGIMAGEQNE